MPAGQGLVEIDGAILPGRLRQRVGVARIGQIRAIQLGGDVAEHDLEGVFPEGTHRDLTLQAVTPPGSAQSMIEAALGAGCDEFRRGIPRCFEGELDQIRLPAVGDTAQAVGGPGRVEGGEEVVARLGWKGFVLRPACPGIRDAVDEVRASRAHGRTLASPVHGDKPRGAGMVAE